MNLSTTNRVSFASTGVKLRKKTSNNRRPQNVKEIKRLSQTRVDKMALIVDGLHHRPLNGRLSISTPNIYFSNPSTKDMSLIPKHKCDSNFRDQYLFKAKPLPQYYSTDSLIRNQKLFKQLKENRLTSSLDAINSAEYSSNQSSQIFKIKSQNNFISDKPFYPPSKYPNIRDKVNSNLQRLIDTREKYKTPTARKLIFKSSKEQSKPITKPKTITKPKMIPTEKPIPRPRTSTNLIIDTPLQKKRVSNFAFKFSDSLFLSNGNQDQMGYSPEIKLVGTYNKLEVQDRTESFLMQPMEEIVHYPKAVSNPYYSKFKKTKSQTLYAKSSIRLRSTSSEC